MAARVAEFTMRNDEEKKKSRPSPWKADVGCGGFLAFLALLSLCLPLFPMCWIGAPALAAGALALAAVDIVRGKKASWVVAVLALVVLALWIKMFAPYLLPGTQRR